MPGTGYAVTNLELLNSPIAFPNPVMYSVVNLNRKFIEVVLRE